MLKNFCRMDEHMKSKTFQTIQAALVIALLSLFLRVASDFRDGLSERALLVGWWSWHIIGWMARDFWQVLFIWFGAFWLAAIRALNRWQLTAWSYLIAAISSWFIHRWLYAFAVEHRAWFQW